MLEMQQYPGMCMNTYHKLLPEIPFNYNSFLYHLHPNHQQLFKDHVKCILHTFSPHFYKKTKCWHFTIGILIELTLLIKTIQSSYSTITTLTFVMSRKHAQKGLYMVFNIPRLLDSVDCFPHDSFLMPAFVKSYM